MKKSLSLLLGLTLVACGGKTPDAPVPAPADATPVAATETVLTLSADQLREAGVSTASVGAATIAETLSVYGEIRATEDRLRRISARYPGLAREVKKNIGDSVSRGDTLVVVESNDSLVPYRISSPISGRVLERHINAGEAMSEQTLFVIADLSRVWAELAVFPNQADVVQRGQVVEVRAERDGGASQTARIDYVAPDAESAARRVTVRATLDNGEGRWRPGQFIAGEIVLAEHPAAVAVPQGALQEMEGQPHVFVQTGKGFVARALRLGRQDRHHAEVLEGVKAGERVVVSNSYLLKSQWLSLGE